MSKFYEALERAGLLSGEDLNEVSQTPATDSFAKRSPQAGAFDVVARQPVIQEHAQNGHTTAELSQISPAEDYRSPIQNQAPVSTSVAEIPAEDLLAEVLADSGVSRPTSAGGTRAQIRIAAHLPVLPNALNHEVLEHYRMLRTQILRRHKDKPFKSLLITSPGPQQGKTVTTLNLAMAFAKIPFFRVLVIEGDLRRGTLTRSIGMDGESGLTNLLDGTAGVDQVITTSPEMAVDFIAKGNSKLVPAELLHSAKLPIILRELTERYNLVLIDCPPVNVVEDTQLLAANCDALLMVTRFLETSCKELTEAIQTVSPYRIIGTVLNGANRPMVYQRYSSYYGAEPDKAAVSKRRKPSVAPGV
jgi:capsular exopolysaccharide synthesis family protein